MPRAVWLLRAAPQSCRRAGQACGGIGHAVGRRQGIARAAP
jgi:hypothetical protein